MDVFVNRTKVHSINTQIVFDATFNILDVVAKWPGSTHDPRILMGSAFCEAPCTSWVSCWVTAAIPARRLDTSQSTTGSTVKVFMLKPSLSLRSTYVTQFLLLIHRKALTLLKYIEDETQKGKKPFRSLRNLKADLDLTVEGDLSIVMAFAEKLRTGLHLFVFGRPFYTSVHERDVLMSF
ncbi:Guanine nucleotide exchange C9orf72 [Merluccius polli]|uniref:Guanine nucleotide exchange C9orf72 n=1 Tax=Merluccius polli TaxID=89951 RepID=A0AA47N6M3_MERPO|nr:Guanine nucleotide exchange C9orf72 [Merluccius polli]